jgi:ABC-type uncharacterized transport system auxiliary subunit
MKKKTRLLSLTAPLLLLAACSGVMDSAQPAKQYYMLAPCCDSSAGGADPGPALVLTVGAVPGLDTDRVLALSGDARLNQYANARWPDHLPEVLTSVIKRSLASSGRFSDVTAGGRAKDGGWFLQLEVQQFYGIRGASGNTSSVVVEVSGSIECGDKRHAFTLTDSNTVGEERLSGVVAAHQRGLDEVTRQVMAEIAQSCS